jgi:hypothetical protein
VGDGGDCFPAAPGWQISENGGGELTGDVGESVSVEKEERSAPVTVPKEVYRFGEAEEAGLSFCPLSRNRLLSLSIKAVLRVSSCARSSVEADDKLPTPVFEKLGSGLYR